MSSLPVCRAAELSEQTLDQPAWLIEGLWAREAVGILGGQPKCCKSFLALDIAVAVASGTPCLRRFAVPDPGPVLLFPAEDSLSVVRQRLEAICAAAHTQLDQLPLFVITAPRLLLDCPEDQRRLHHTLTRIRPAILLLDPFIRLHRIDENASKEVAPILGFLRNLQREFHLAVLLVHHVRKNASGRPGQALRGSSDLHGWGDSNLYLNRQKDLLRLSIEHRAAPSTQSIPLHLRSYAQAAALEIAPEPQQYAAESPSARERVIHALRVLDRPASARQIRTHCRMRAETLAATLEELLEHNIVRRSDDGFSLSPQMPLKGVSRVSIPIDEPGNGNGKHPQMPLFTPAHQQA